MNNDKKYTEELNNHEWTSPVPVYLLTSWFMERCIGWRKEVLLVKKYFTVRFLFLPVCLEANNNPAHSPAPAPAEFTDVVCSVVTSESTIQRSPAPPHPNPSLLRKAQEACSKGLPSLSPASKGKERERRQKGGGKLQQVVWNEQKKKRLPSQKACAEPAWLTNCHCWCPSLPLLSFVIHQKHREDSESYQGGIFHHKKLRSSN